MNLPRKRSNKSPAGYLREPLVDVVGEVISAWTYPSMPWSAANHDWRQVCRLRAREVLNACEERRGAVDSLMDNPDTGRVLEEIAVIHRVVVGRLLSPGRDYREFSGRGAADALLAVKWPNEALKSKYFERYLPWANAMSKLLTLHGKTYIQLTLDYIDGEKPRIDEIDALTTAIRAY